MPFLASPAFKVIAVALVAIASVVETLAGSNTIAFSVADKIIHAGIAIGIINATGGGITVGSPVTGAPGSNLRGP